MSEELDPYLPWELGFSSGKDSTKVLTLLLEAMRRGARIQKLYVVYAGMLLEHHPPENGSRELKSLKAFPNVEPVRFVPYEDFVTLMIEMGYPAPSHRFRWCIARLKIGPCRAS